MRCLILLSLFSLFLIGNAGVQEHVVKCMSGRDNSNEEESINRYCYVTKTTDGFAYGPGNMACYGKYEPTQPECYNPHEKTMCCKGPGCNQDLKTINCAEYAPVLKCPSEIAYATDKEGVMVHCHKKYDHCISFYDIPGNQTSSLCKNQEHIPGFSGSGCANSTSKGRDVFVCCEPSSMGMQLAHEWARLAFNGQSYKLMPMMNSEENTQMKTTVVTVPPNNGQPQPRTNSQEVSYMKTAEVIVYAIFLYMI